MKRRRADGRTYFDQTYIPIDEILAIPRIRVMRMLRRFDWCSATDIRDALHVPEHQIASYNTALSRLVRDGHVDRTGRNVSHYRYQLNDSGRVNLRQWMARAELPNNGSSLSVVAS